MLPNDSAWWAELDEPRQKRVKVGVPSKKRAHSERRQKLATKIKQDDKEKRTTRSTTPTATRSSGEETEALEASDDHDGSRAGDEERGGDDDTGSEFSVSSEESESDPNWSDRYLPIVRSCLVVEIGQTSHTQREPLPLQYVCFRRVGRLRMPPLLSSRDCPCTKYPVQ